MTMAERVAAAIARVQRRGYRVVNVQLTREDQRTLASEIRGGDEVAIVTTFDGVPVKFAADDESVIVFEGVVPL